MSILFSRRGKEDGATLLLLVISMSTIGATLTRDESHPWRSIPAYGFLRLELGDDVHRGDG